MALCGVRCGRLRCLFKWLVKCIHSLHFSTNIKQMNSCFFFTLAKEKSGELILLNWISFFVFVIIIIIIKLLLLLLL